MSSRGGSGSLRCPAPTQAVEGVLLFLIAALIPIQDTIGLVMGMSVVYLAMLAGFAWVGLFRLSAFLKVLTQPVFVGLALFAVVVGVSEMFSPQPSMRTMRRLIELSAGVALLATLARDRKGLTWLLWGCLAGALFLSVHVWGASYGVLTQAEAADYDEASRVQKDAMRGMELVIDLNFLGTFVAQGAIIALALFLHAKTLWSRILYGGLAGYTAVATFLPMSRSAVAALALGLVGLFWCMARGGARLRGMLLIFGFLALAAILVPDAALGRLKFSDEALVERPDSRAQVYGTFFDNLDKTLPWGVGLGNFYGGWGPAHGWYHPRRPDVPIGPHNFLFGVIIYWGLPGLAALGVLVFTIIRCLPPVKESSALRPVLIGVGLLTAIVALTSNEIVRKEYAVYLGLLAGGRAWVWGNWPIRTKRQRRKTRGPARTSGEEGIDPDRPARW